MPNIICGNFMHDLNKLGVRVLGRGVANYSCKDIVLISHKCVLVSEALDLLCEVHNYMCILVSHVGDVFRFDMSCKSDVYVGRIYDSSLIYIEVPAGNDRL